MIESTGLKVAAIAVAAALVFGGGWHARGLKADSDMAKYKEEQRAEVAKQDTAVKEVEKVDATNTQESTARLDVAEPQRAVEVRYVTQQVIKYKDRPVAGKCTLPVDWVRVYNSAGTGKTGELPDATPTGPAPSGTADSVPAVARAPAQ